MRKGYALFEVLIFIVLFTSMSLAFITVFISVMRINVRQTSAAEVNGQSQFLLTTIEQEVMQAASIDDITDPGTLTMHPAPADFARDPVEISLIGTTVYLQEAGGTPEPLTSQKVKVDALTFTKQENPSARDVVSVLFTMSYNSQSPQQQYTRTLRTSVQKLNP